MAASRTCSTEMYSSLSLLGLVLGRGEQPVQPRGDVDLVGCAGRPGDLRHAVEFRLEARREGFQIDAGLRQDGGRQSALLFEQRGEQVFDVDLLVAVADRLRLRGPDRLLQLFGETIDVHTFILGGRAAGAVRFRTNSRYHVAFHLPRADGETVVAEALDFPGAVTQGFDLADEAARNLLELDIWVEYCSQSREEALSDRSFPTGDARDRRFQGSWDTGAAFFKLAPA